VPSGRGGGGVGVGCQREGTPKAPMRTRRWPARQTNSWAAPRFCALCDVGGYRAPQARAPSTPACFSLPGPPFADPLLEMRCMQRAAGNKLEQIAHTYFITSGTYI
jgi:hypothetical protein